MSEHCHASANSAYCVNGPLTPGQPLYSQCLSASRATRVRDSPSSLKSPSSLSSPPQHGRSSLCSLCSAALEPLREHATDTRTAGGGARRDRDDICRARGHHPRALAVPSSCAAHRYLTWLVVLMPVSYLVRPVSYLVRPVSPLVGCALNAHLVVLTTYPVGTRLEDTDTVPADEAGTEHAQARRQQAIEEGTRIKHTDQAHASSIKHTDQASSTPALSTTSGPTIGKRAVCLHPSAG